MQVVVFGGRYFKDKRYIYRKLDRVHADTPITLIIHGGAPGAAAFGKEWAEDNEIDCLRVPPKWTTIGDPADPVRNSRIVQTYSPDLAVKAPGGKSTKDMKKKLQATGVEIV